MATTTRSERSARPPGPADRPGTGRERVFLGLGSNVGNRAGSLRRALRMIGSDPLLRVVQVSRLYSTAPVGYTPQRDFLNGALELRTRLDPRTLLARLARIEETIGKDVPFRNGPRRIDIDLLLYGKRAIRARGLVVPHPRLHRRRFVLVPLAEIAPRVIHPLLRRTAGRLLDGLGPGGGVRPWGDWQTGGSH